MIRKILLPSWLIVFWCILWGNFSALTLFGGTLITCIVMLIFKLPTIFISGRFNFFYAFISLIWLIKELFFASYNVTKIAIKHGNNVKNSIFAIKLRPTSPFITTLTSHMVTLVPGSSVIDIDFSNNLMYVHALNANNQDSIDYHKKNVLLIQKKIIKIMGSTSEHLMLKKERQLR